MGRYLNKGLGLHKVDALLALEGANELLLGEALGMRWETIPAGKAVVVVARNGHFDAAAWCYDAEELAYWQDVLKTDRRLIVPMLLDEAVVRDLSGWGE